MLKGLKTKQKNLQLFLLEKIYTQGLQLSLCWADSNDNTAHRLTPCIANFASFTTKAFGKKN